MFKKRKVLQGVCLVVLVPVVISIIQLRPTKLSGKEVDFIVRGDWRIRVSSSTTILKFSFKSFDSFELKEKNGQFSESWFDDGERFYIHKDSPAGSEFPSYAEFGLLTDRVYEFLVRGGDVYVSFVDGYRPYEIGYVEGPTIEVSMFPTISEVARTLVTNLIIIGVLFALLILIVKFFEKRRISWKKRETSFERGILFIILVISIFVLVLLCIVQTSKKEYVGAEMVFVVPANWFLRVKTPSLTHVDVESEGPMCLVLERENPSPECEVYAFENEDFDFVGAPANSGHIRADRPNKYFFKEEYFFDNYYSREICQGDYVWYLSGDKTFLSLSLFYENTEEISVEVYPSRQAVYQIIFNNLKLILLIDILVFATVFVARRVKIKKIE